MSVHLWGGQVEKGAFATSYIPNLDTGAGVTRTADVASVSTQAFPYSGTEGTLVVNGQTFATATAQIAQLDSGDSNRMQIAFDGSTMNYAVVVGGSAVVVASTTKTASVKAAAAYKQDDFAVSFNGAAAVPDTSGAVPPVTTLTIGKASSASGYLNGWVRQITYIPRRLTNAELISRAS